MKRALLLFCVFCCSSPYAVRSAEAPIDSLLQVLDRTIENRPAFTAEKESQLAALKERKARLQSPAERYRVNEEIIAGYESLVCDSAEVYIRENIAIAERLPDVIRVNDSKIRLAFIYSVSGQFVQAAELFRTLYVANLSREQQVSYCWTKIRYYENLGIYMDNSKLLNDYAREIDALRTTVMGLLPADSEEYLKEKAFQIETQGGNIDDAIAILTSVYRNQALDTHGSAMAAMSLAKAYRAKGDREQENEFLTRAAISDIRFAVKENEALLKLAMNLFEQGEITRSYNYISLALSDANFYNSRFRNTVFARVQPVIESNYLYRIEQQRFNLRIYTLLLSLLVVVLVVMLIIILRQMRITSRARVNLKHMNEQLVLLNRRLGDANIVKERYIGYFMNQCALYINKLDAYRKDINHKLKNGQIDRLYKPSANELEKEVEELYTNFDEAFLKLYPDFVNQFNLLLEPAARYKLEYVDRLNTELRIYALIRLGITNVNQIAEFLRCSLQTIYNYKSKVKSKARKEIANFEEEVKKLGLAIYESDSI